MSGQESGDYDSPQKDIEISRSPTMPLSGDRASEVSRKIEESDPNRLFFQNDPDVGLQNALLLIDKGKYKSALQILRRIISDHPEHSETVYWLGYCFASIGDGENAMKCYRALVDIDPSEESYSALAETLYELGKSEDAEHCYLQALQLVKHESPLLFGIYKNLGNICVGKKDFDSAEEYYNKAHVLYPNSDDIYVNFGTLEIQRGNQDIAVERFKKALEINSRNEKAWTGLAMLNREKSDNELANAQLRIALDIDPYNQVAIQLLVQWSFADASFEYAIGVLDKYLDKNSEDHYLSYTLAAILFEIGRKTHAQIELARTLSLKPDYQAALELQALLNKGENQ